MNNTPLVSIPVITYNSSEYIIGGLESIKSQTYKNIEIVISDDCSTDDTVDICNKWIEENRLYFKRAILVTTEKNKGVAGNLNRAIRECKGEWIKPLSGDDKFLPYTIERYVAFLSQNTSCNIAFAKLQICCEDPAIVSKVERYFEKMYYSKIKIKDQKKQKYFNLQKLFVPGPGLIYKKSLWEKVGGFDEKYPFCEEDPFMLKVFDEKEIVFFINEELYAYYLSFSSLSRNTDVISRHLRDRIRHYREIRRKRQFQHGMFFQIYKETFLYKHLEAKERHSKILIFYEIIRPIGISENINKLKVKISDLWQKIRHNRVLQ